MNKKLCIICEHLAVNPARKAAVYRDEPLHPTDSGIVMLCDDGDDPCSQKGEKINADGLLTVHVSHYQEILSRPGVLAALR